MELGYSDTVQNAWDKLGKIYCVDRISKKDCFFLGYNKSFNTNRARIEELERIVNKYEKELNANDYLKDENQLLKKIIKSNITVINQLIQRERDASFNKEIRGRDLY